jgi:hypothetical protein
LWKAYIQLTQAEAAFRIQKDQINVRPIWHQREDRVQAHILKSLEMWQQRAGLGNSAHTILEELARVQSNNVVLPTATHGQIRLRCMTQHDAAQAALLAASVSSCPGACAFPNRRHLRSPWLKQNTSAKMY